MQKLTGYNIVSAINALNKNVDYQYVNQNNHAKIRIVDIRLPGGPIVIRRWDPTKGGSFSSARDETISQEMIWRIANAFFEGQPINFDRILGGSYNTRSVLESLIAHTPEFRYCFPGRIFDLGGSISVEHGHKHIVWLPNCPHRQGELCLYNVDTAISELPISSAVYESLSIPNISSNNEIDIKVQRRHTQIQIGLYEIGKQLGYRTWIAQNDLGIRYHDIPLVEHPQVVHSLNDERMVSVYDGAVDAGRLIDCIWFQNGRLMPAVMEVEHTTGITSGLTRMKNFYDKVPAIRTRYVIVAPDEDKEKVFEKGSREMFRSLDVRFFSYSAVEELYVMCKRRKIRGVTEEFLDCFMERVLLAC